MGENEIEGNGKEREEEKPWKEKWLKDGEMFREKTEV